MSSSDSARVRQEPQQADARRVSNETLIPSVAHAREKIAALVEDYNTGRSHSSPGYATPAAFVSELKRIGLFGSA
jgi:transposase InsO family protein